MKPVNPGRMPMSLHEVSPGRMPMSLHEVSLSRRAMLLHEVIVTTDMGVCHLTVNLQMVMSGCCHLAGNGGR